MMCVDREIRERESGRGISSLSKKASDSRQAR